jgi:DNA-binding NarL/FixJ family response regulator
MKRKPARAAAPARRKVLLVDDHPITRQGLAQLVGNEPDLVVCGEAQDASGAITAVATLKPALVVVDLSLPGRSGLELIKDLAATHPEVFTLVLSMHDEMLYAERVLRAGARGYLMKQEGGLKVIEAIRRILEGQIYVSERMGARILEAFSGRRAGGAESPVGRFSDREFEVFQMIGEGLGTREIAGRLGLSIKTVEVHRAHLKEKLQVRDAPGLVREAVRWVEAQRT